MELPVALLPSAVITLLSLTAERQEKNSEKATLHLVTSFFSRREGNPSSCMPQRSCVKGSDGKVYVSYQADFAAL